MRSSAGAVCMTERVISYFVRYSSRLLACFTCSASASASGVSAGSRIPWARASSSIVCGRRQPSRWTCNSALGQRRSTSLERRGGRSEEHTSELQSLAYLVCRLLLEKKKKNITSRQDVEHLY